MHVSKMDRKWIMCNLKMVDWIDPLAWLELYVCSTNKNRVLHSQLNSTSYQTCKVFCWWHFNLRMSQVHGACTQCIATKHDNFLNGNKYTYTMRCVHMWLVRQIQFYRQIIYEWHVLPYDKDERKSECVDTHAKCGTFIALNIANKK